MQQLAQQLAVMNIRRRGRHRVNQLGLTIDTNMSLHAEVPLIAFLRLMHLRITDFILVLGRAGRIDDRCIDDGTGTHFQPIFLKILIDQYKQLIAQVMRFKQMAELTNRGLVRRRLASQVDAHKAAHGPRVIQSFFHGRIGQVEPMLQEMYAQHPLQAERPAAWTLRLRIKRLDHFAQITLRDNLIHFLEKLFPTCWLAKLLEAFFAERSLPHSANPQLA